MYDELMRALGDELDRKDSESEAFLYQHFEILRNATAHRETFARYYAREGTRDIVEYARAVAHKRLQPNVEDVLDKTRPSFCAQLRRVQTYAKHLCAVHDEGGFVNPHDVHPAWMWSAVAAELTLLANVHLMSPAFEGDRLRDTVRTSVVSIINEIACLRLHPNDCRDKKTAFEERQRHVEDKLRAMANT